MSPQNIKKFKTIRYTCYERNPPRSYVHRYDIIILITEIEIK